MKSRLPVLALVGALSFIGAASAQQSGTADDAKALLAKAAAAVRADKASALARFDDARGGFKDRDLYVYCANASDGIYTAHPTHKGKQLKDVVGKKGYPLGKEIMEKATEGKISEITYWWPRPGSDKPVEKHTFFTKAGDQICAVGYYKE